MNKKQNKQNKNAWEEATSRDNLGRKINVHKYDLEKLTVALMGDEHMGSKYYNKKLHLNHLEWCDKYSVPIVLMGDELETATKSSIGAGIYEQEDIVQQQLENCVKTYKPLADKGLVLGNHLGNHENRVFSHSGANLSKILSMMLKVPYLGVGAVHYFLVGKQNYTLYTTHGSSGARLPHTKIANTIKMSNMIDCDIYAQGHLHQLSHHVQNYYTINKRKKTVEESQKHYILCGSYLTHWGSYAHVSNMEPARNGSPKLKLSGLEHRIRVSI